MSIINKVSTDNLFLILGLFIFLGLSLIIWLVIGGLLQTHEDTTYSVLKLLVSVPITLVYIKMSERGLSLLDERMDREYDL